MTTSARTYTKAEAAAILGDISLKRVQQLLADGSLEATYRDNKPLITQRSLKAEVLARKRGKRKRGPKPKRKRKVSAR